MNNKKDNEGRADKFYSRKEIAEMLDVEKWRVEYAIKQNKIKPARVEGGWQGWNGRPTLLFTRAAIIRICVYFFQIEKKRVKAKSRQSFWRDRTAAKDASRGEHDADGLAWILACEKYQNEKQMRWLKKSDYLEVLKTMPKDWLARVLKNE